MNTKELKNVFEKLQEKFPTLENYEDKENFWELTCKHFDPKKEDRKVSIQVRSFDPYYDYQPSSIIEFMVPYASGTYNEVNNLINDVGDFAVKFRNDLLTNPTLQLFPFIQTNEKDENITNAIIIRSCFYFGNNSEKNVENALINLQGLLNFLFNSTLNEIYNNLINAMSEEEADKVKDKYLKEITELLKTSNKKNTKEEAL